MPIFQYNNGIVNVLATEGEVLSQEEALIVSLSDIAQQLREASEHLSGISFALTEGEQRVHRTN